MKTAAELLDQDPLARMLGRSAGLAAYLRAIPELEDAGRIPLVDGTHDGLRACAKAALDPLPNAISARNPALWPAIGARPTLRQVMKDPAAVSQGRLDPGLTSWRLLRVTLTKRL